MTKAMSQFIPIWLSMMPQGNPIAIYPIMTGNAALKAVLMVSDLDIAHIILKDGYE